MKTRTCILESFPPPFSSFFFLSSFFFFFFKPWSTLKGHPSPASCLVTSWSLIPSLSSGRCGIRPHVHGEWTCTGDLNCFSWKRVRLWLARRGIQVTALLCQHRMSSSWKIWGQCPASEEHLLGTTSPEEISNTWEAYNTCSCFLLFLLRLFHCRVEWNSQGA